MNPRTSYALFAVAAALFSAVGWVMTEVILRFYEIDALLAEIKRLEIGRLSRYVYRISTLLISNLSRNP